LGFTVESYPAGVVQGNAWINSQMRKNLGKEIPQEDRDVFREQKSERTLKGFI